LILLHCNYTYSLIFTNTPISIYYQKRKKLVLTILTSILPLPLTAQIQIVRKIFFTVILAIPAFFVTGQVKPGEVHTTGKNEVPERKA
jgi:hypothetical protein